MKKATRLKGPASGDSSRRLRYSQWSGSTIHSCYGISGWDRSGLVRIPDASGPIHGVHTAILPADKQRAFYELRSGEAEGVVFKDARSHPTGGRPGSGGGQLKFKFVTTATFMAAAVNKRRSVALVLLDGGERVPAGNLTIPPGHDIPSPEDVIEARYLYAYRQSGNIYQPVYLGRRDDLDPVDCQTGQLKYKDESVAA